MNKSFAEQINFLVGKTIDHSGFTSGDWIDVTMTWLGSVPAYEVSSFAFVMVAKEFVTEDLARLAAINLDEGELKTEIADHFRQLDERQAAHDRAMQAAEASAKKTWEEKEALARAAKIPNVGLQATIGEHSGKLMKWKKMIEDTEWLYGYYLEGAPHGMSCGACNIPITFMRHEVTQ